MNDTTGLQPKSACFAKVVCCVLGLDAEWDCFLNRAWDQLLHVVVVIWYSVKNAKNRVSVVTLALRANQVKQLEQWEGVDIE